MGRKSVPILLKATSPEGETKMFASIGEAAKELGFSECGVGKAFHEKRNIIGEYELEPEPDVDPKLDVHPGAAKRIERLKKTFSQIVCTYCGTLWWYFSTNQKDNKNIFIFIFKRILS